MLDSDLPKAVKICECWARDGLQGERNIIPTDQKIRVIDAFTDLGLKRIETTSFSHPKLIPQFAASVDVLKGIKRAPDATYVALAPNVVGMRRLAEAQQLGFGAHEVIVVVAASEAHTLANIDKTKAEALAELDAMIVIAHDAGIRVNACITTAFGCPLTGLVPVETVVELSNWYRDRGCDLIMIGDTTGEANPLQVRRTFAELLDRVPGVDFIAHFHDTRGAGIANAVAALEAGIVYHDSSFGGMGGQPATTKPVYHRGLTGNVATEDLVSVFQEMGVDTGVDPDRVMDVAALVEEVVGRPLQGKTARGAGRPRKLRDEPLLFEDLEPGKLFPANLFHVPADGVPMLTPTLVDDTPVYLDQEFARRVRAGRFEAHPALAAVFLPASYMADRKLPEGVVLARQEIETLMPLQPKDILVSFAKVAERRESGGRKQVVIAVETVKSDGKAAARARFTLLWPH